MLGLIRYIDEYGKGLDIPFPAAVALWSPWVDVDAALHRGIEALPNYKTEYLSQQSSEWGANSISASPEVDPSGPYLSPLHHPFTLVRTIPTFLNAGEREVLCHDIQQFSKIYQSYGWPLQLFASNGCPHDVLLIDSRIGFAKEAEEAVKCASTFLASAISLPLHSQARCIT